jgi:hypothetical protein
MAQGVTMQPLVPDVILLDQAFALLSGYSA